jgi:hypothetical protein
MRRETKVIKGRRARKGQHEGEVTQGQEGMNVWEEDQRKKKKRIRKKTNELAAASRVHVELTQGTTRPGDA